MRVLIASKLNTRHSYGSSNRALYLGRYLAEKVDVFHVGVDCPGIEHGGSRSTGSLTVTAFAREIRRAVREFDPDVVVGLEHRATLACRWLTARGMRLPWVIGFDSSPAFEWKSYRSGSRPSRIRCAARYARSRIIERAILSSGAPVVVASAFLKDLIREWYAVAEERIHVIPNGAPAEMLEEPPSKPPSPYACLGGGGEIALLMAPRHFHSNVLAVRFAHEVAEHLRFLAPDARILVTGAGPTLGAAPNVHYAGHVDNVVPYIDFADVCLLPYPADAVCGGARLKALEYLARGKPVLATPEGIRGIDGIRDGVEAVIAPANPDDFARSLSDLIRDRSRRGALGLAARDFVALRHDWRLLARQLLDILEGHYDRT
jgi:glycosyltransferase involved in cell wall biosynthesis